MKFFNVSLAQENWSATYALRYIGEVEENFTNIDPDDLADVNSSFRTEAVNIGGTLDSYDVIRTVDSQVIHNVRFSYFLDNYTATVGINNVFDEDPPYAATGFNDNTDPRTYNTTGRHIFLTLNAKF